MEKVHGVASLNQHEWLPERLHRTIAVLSNRERFKPEKARWRNMPQNVIHGTSPLSLAQRAWLLKDKKGVHYAGQKTWPRYIAWVRKKYGGDYAEKEWRKEVNRVRK